MRILVNRLRIVHEWQERPEVLATPIERPVFILGLPRTGTTALHHLLAQDPGTQFLENWLGNAPQTPSAAR